MAEKIRIGILGYGNLGRGLIKAVGKNPDMELIAVFTRRDPSSIGADGIKAEHVSEIYKYTDKIDVMILCGGSATDLPIQTPEYARLFNVLDSFDTHADIPEHFARTDAAARESGHAAMISCGWDPGLFSIARIYSEAVLPDGVNYTFWGPGVSQGHSDAIRRIKGVKDARQYTIPVREAVDRVRGGETPELTTREKHTRKCFVVAEDGADLSRIEREIKEMPKYFADYDTTVHFISEEELLRDHAGLPHGGSVLRSGTTSRGCVQNIEFSLRLDSNPEFTSSVLAACARAVYRMHQKGENGCFTLADIPPAMLHMNADLLHAGVI